MNMFQAQVKVVREVLLNSLVNCNSQYRAREVVVLLGLNKSTEYIAEHCDLTHTLVTIMKHECITVRRNFAQFEDFERNIGPVLAHSDFEKAVVCVAAPTSTRTITDRLPRIHKEDNTMNQVNLLLANKLAGFKFVKVVFDTVSLHSQKQYTYKTNLDLEVGDLCVVDTPKGVCEVVRVSSLEADGDGGYDYKWIVSKVDKSSYNALRELEEECRTIVTSAVKAKQQAAQYKQLEEDLGEDILAKVSESIAKRTRI